MTNTIRVAVIGAGMAGKAHAAGYKAAGSVYKTNLPKIELMAISDINEAVGRDAQVRYGYQRYESDWRKIAEAGDIDAVSVVVANSLHREIVEALLAAGKHVLCEKPLSDTLENAQAIAVAAEAAEAKGILARIGFSFLRAPGIAFIRKLIDDGRLGKINHFSGRYWCDYGAHADAPFSWRYQGPMGSGALGDVGSHLSYIAEYLCGETLEVSGGRFYTAISHRPKPSGAVVGHTRGGGGELTPVENDDYAAYSARFTNTVGTLQVSRVASGHPNGLLIEVFGTKGAARWEQANPSQVEVLMMDDPDDISGYRTIPLSGAHPYYSGGWPVDAPGVGIGQNDLFLHQVRAFLEEVAGIPEAESLPRCAKLTDGVHNMELLAAVAKSAAQNGAAVTVPTGKNTIAAPKR
ncbi:Gfo/Idh/MocA family oxidoreductase [Pasteurellaceae bacterium LIM206]|nr:Gfo/Idh/MocA family oxidoreductase [Pasteurellaceae bacterium LIM206]